MGTVKIIRKAEEIKEPKKRMTMIVIKVEKDETKSEYFENLEEGINFAHEGSTKTKDADYYHFLEEIPRLKEKKSKKKTEKSSEIKEEFVPFSLKDIKKAVEKTATKYGIGTYIALVLEKGQEFGGVSISKRK